MPLGTLSHSGPRRHMLSWSSSFRIKGQAGGGGHDADNLIASCVNCHAEIHTETKLTRRFTANELKQHRDDVYQLVAEGKLVGEADHDDRIAGLVGTIAGLLAKGVP